MLKQQAGQDNAWWKESVIYQIYPRSFKDSNNDGIGDLPGIIEKLPYLQSLGVTMLWISPFFLSPMADNGYDIADYYAVNPEFGEMRDVDTLIDKAAVLGIKIMIDLVVNHTSDEHQWFQQALADADSPYRDYYLFRPAVNGLPPNNWRSIFGGSAWEKVPGEETYYLHVFHKKQPDLNWENPQMREAIYRMINWWLEKGVAGFRVDAITFIKKDADYASVPVDGVDGLGSIKSKARNRPGIDVFLNELKENTFDKYACVTVGEAPGVPCAEYGQFIGENGYFDMIFDFHAADIDVENGSEWFRRRDWTVAELREALFDSQNAFAQCGWGTCFIENHDQPRALSKLVHPDYQNATGAKCLAAMYFFLRGTPYIYQGQELGMTNFCRSDISEFDDISSIDNYHRALAEGFSERQSLAFVNHRSRDNSRTPFPWDNTVNSGFNQGTKPWLALSAEDALINAAAQQQDADSVFAFYQQLIRLRKEYSDALIWGDFIPLETASPEIISYQRCTASECFTSVTNLSNHTVYYKIPEGDVIVNNYPQLSSSLKPYQSILIKGTIQYE